MTSLAVPLPLGEEDRMSRRSFLHATQAFCTAIPLDQGSRSTLGYLEMDFYLFDCVNRVIHPNTQKHSFPDRTALLYNKLSLLVKLIRSIVSGYSVIFTTICVLVCVCTTGWWRYHVLWVVRVFWGSHQPDSSRTIGGMFLRFTGHYHWTSKWTNWILRLI